MIELFEEYILSNWHIFHFSFPVPNKLSYLFVKGFRKTILFVFKDEDKNPFAVLKATKDPIAFDRLSKEYETLSYLANNTAIEGVVPRPLALFELMGHTCVLESALGGTPLVYSIKGVRTKGGILKMKNIFSMVVDILIRFSTVIRTKTGNTKKRLTVIEHGDFNPSNLFVSRDGLRMFDWEYSNIDGTPLHDLLDFSLKYVLFARYLTCEITREKPVLDDFEEAFLSRKPHSNIIWKNIAIYKEYMNISTSSMQDFFSDFSIKYLSESDAGTFCNDLDALISSSLLMRQ
jgi:hypothetical protein